MSKGNIARVMLDAALEARENYARTLYSVVDVQALIKAAALKGETQLRVPQDKAHDLQLTEAALKLVAVLEGRGFRCHWFPVTIPERVKGQATGRQLGYRELTIDWSGADGRQGANAILEKDIDGIVQFIGE